MCVGMALLTCNCHLGNLLWMKELQLGQRRSTTGREKEELFHQKRQEKTAFCQIVFFILLLK